MRMWDQRWRNSSSRCRTSALTSKYRFMEMSTAQRRLGLEQKIPDISKTLDMVRLLKQRRVRLR